MSGEIFPRIGTSQGLMQWTHTVFREEQFGVEKGIGSNQLL